jgi:hypothetical protein
MEVEISFNMKFLKLYLMGRETRSGGKHKSLQNCQIAIYDQISS